MKKFLVLVLSVLVLVVFPKNLEAGTCTTISRTDVGANSVLTSSKYNTDHNTAYAAHNAFDGGCVTDGTLESGALNTTDFSVLLNAPIEGCVVTRSDAATINVGRCRIAVNGTYHTTTSDNSVTWGCSGCSSETSATVYYVYVKTGDSFALLISTSAPNNDGYDSSGNRVIGRFYNDAGSDIEDVQNVFKGNVYSTPPQIGAQAQQAIYMAVIDFTSGTPTVSSQTGEWIASLADTAVGASTATVATGKFSATPMCVASATTASTTASINATSATSLTLRVFTTSSGSGVDATMTIFCMGDS